MKRFVAIVGILAGLGTMYGGIADFNSAKTGFELFKALFWLLIGGGASYAFTQDFKNNEWPF